MSTKKLSDLRAGDEVAYYPTKNSHPIRRQITSGGDTIMIYSSGNNPAFCPKTGRRVPYMPGNTAYITMVTPELKASWKHEENLEKLREMISRASPGHVEEMLNAYPAQHDHHVQLSASDRAQLLAWLADPNGACIFQRVTFEAVVGGGVLVRTKPY